MATTEQITVDAQNLVAIGNAAKHLRPTMPVQVSHAQGLITLIWEPNGTTGAIVQDGKITWPEGSEH